MSDDKDLNPNGSTGDGTGDGSGDGGQGSVPKSGLKETLEKELGKQFPDEATAIKAVKDTFSMVNRSAGANRIIQNVMQSKSMNEAQAIEFLQNSVAKEPEKVDTSKFVSKDELLERDFFSENPLYKPYKELISMVKKANPDKTLSQVIEMKEVKDVLTKSLAQDENQKSIVHSNPKLGISQDNLTKAKEAAKSGDQLAAESLATKSVMDAFNF